MIVTDNELHHHHQHRSSSASSSATTILRAHEWIEENWRFFFSSLVSPCTITCFHLETQWTQNISRYLQSYSWSVLFRLRFRKFDMLKRNNLKLIKICWKSAINQEHEKKRCEQVKVCFAWSWLEIELGPDLWFLQHRNPVKTRS